MQLRVAEVMQQATQIQKTDLVDARTCHEANGGGNRLPQGSVNVSRQPTYALAMSAVMAEILALPLPA
jgi:hypothetical protein